MAKAIETAEWVDNFKWESEDKVEKRDWSSEEDLCFDLVFRYAEDNCPFENKQQAKDDMKIFFEAAHRFINYEPPMSFAGFDWFLATIYIICEGKIETCVFLLIFSILLLIVPQRAANQFCYDKNQHKI